MIYVSQPVDKTAVLADKERMRNAIFVYTCFMPGMQCTLKDICTAFGYRRDKAWTRISELVRAGRVTTLPTTRNRSLVYEITTEENLCQ